ncbi:MAG TPA: hypothetical protein VHU81_21035 [Thermoanaerobaculia bacterium]|jgi:hypothetical protein|nr:hypothetical protein [Thermoanaerobaculia bacterium]
MKRSLACCVVALFALLVSVSALSAAPAAAPAPQAVPAADCGTPSPLAFLNEKPVSPVQSDKGIPGMLPEPDLKACCTAADNQACKDECIQMGCTGGGSICIHTCECKPCFCP